MRGRLPDRGWIRNCQTPRWGVRYLDPIRGFPFAAGRKEIRPARRRMGDLNRGPCGGVGPERGRGPVGYRMPSEKPRPSWGADGSQASPRARKRSTEQALKKGAKSWPTTTGGASVRVMLADTRRPAGGMDGRGQRAKLTFSSLPLTYDLTTSTTPRLPVSALDGPLLHFDDDFAPRDDLHGQGQGRK